MNDKGIEVISFATNDHLENKNVQTRPVFTGNILKQPGFKKIKYRNAVKDFPNTEDVMKNAFVVACHHGLSETQVKYLQKCFDEFLEQFK